MYCGHCGKEVHERASVCLACGASANHVGKFCRNCGQENAEVAVVCTKCGAPYASRMPSGPQANLQTMTTVIAILHIIGGVFGVMQFFSLFFLAAIEGTYFFFLIVILTYGMGLVLAPCCCLCMLLPFVSLAYGIVAIAVGIGIISGNKQLRHYNTIACILGILSLVTFNLWGVIVSAIILALVHSNDELRKWFDEK